MALKKLCSYHGCRKVIEDGIKYCDYHQHLYMERQKKSYEGWKVRHISNVTRKELEEFYGSDEWKTARSAAIADCYAIDIFEYYRTGRIVQGEVVHHIIEAKEDRSLRLTRSNLIYLTNENHGKIHKKYNLGYEKREQVQDLLFLLKEKFEKEFRVI